jgi:hypothetical protein
MFVIKQGDLSPGIYARLRDADGSIPSLSGKTVAFRFRTRPMGAIRGGAATVLDASDAKVGYDWVSGDTDQPGHYIGEWIVTDGDGLETTYPGADFDEFAVMQRID